GRGAGRVRGAAGGGRLCPGGGVRALPVLCAPAVDRQHLVNRFLYAQVAFPAVQATRAELAAVGAADLSGDTKRLPVARFSIQRPTGGNQHAFDQRMVIEPPKKFLRRVLGAPL